MSEFTMNTPAGPFYVDEVYIEYDGPRLFACHDGNKVQHIGTWVDEAPNVNTWVFTPVASRDASAFHRGELPLRTLMLSPLGGSCLLVRLSADPTLQYSERVVPGEIPAEYLPDEGACLPRAERELLLLTSTVEGHAETTNREALDIYVQQTDRCQDNRIEAAKLGGVLSAMQTLASASARRGAMRVRLDRTYYPSTRLLVAGFMMGSFGVRLEACGELDLFRESAATEVMENMVRLLGAVHDVDELSKILADNRRAGPAVRQLLTVVSEGKLDFRAEWGSPSGRSESVEFSPVQSHAALAAIDLSSVARTAEFAVHGRLVGLMADTNRFRLVDDAGKRYNGTYVPELMDSGIGNLPLSHIAKGISCTAVLVEEQRPLPLGKRLHRKYRLLEIAPD